MIEKGKKLLWCFCDIEFNVITKPLNPKKIG